MATTSNLDLNDKLVKRGVVVSWHGFQADVLCVRTGRCLVRFRGFRLPASPKAGRTLTTGWLQCASVQVVRS